jgi:hypothetical protein
MTTADVGNVDLHPITDIDDVGWIAAIFGDHAVDEHNFCAKLDEAPCQRGTDKAYTTGDHYPRTGKRLEARIETGAHHLSRSTEIPPVPGLLGATFRLGEARRNKIRPQTNPVAAKSAGCPLAG